MSSVLAFVSVQGGRVSRGSLEVLSRSREISSAVGQPLSVVIVHPDAVSFTDVVAGYGPDKVYVVTDSPSDAGGNAPLRAAIEAVAVQDAPSLLTMASSETTKDILGALAVGLGATAIPDVAQFEFDGSRLTADRPVLAAKYLSEVECAGRMAVVSVRSGSYEAVERPSQPEIVNISAPPLPTAPMARVREVVESASEGVDLSEAAVVVAAGRGVKDEAGRDLILELAGALGAGVGASRAVVENGLFPATAQIGQTGKVVSPDLYIAVGISGAIQHVAGMLNSRTIVAVNKDPDATIFEYATYGLVGDLYTIVPLLTRAFRERAADN